MGVALKTAIRLDVAAMNKMMDKTCRACGYDLTGLEVQGRCPECGGYYDGWSGEGLARDATDKYVRGDRVVAVVGIIVMVLVALLVLVLGALFTWKSGRPGSLILSAAVSLIFLVGAVVGGVSLRRR